jgi:hypothetical protein
LIAFFFCLILEFFPSLNFYIFFLLCKLSAMANYLQLIWDKLFLLHQLIDLFCNNLIIPNTSCSQIYLKKSPFFIVFYFQFYYFLLQFLELNKYFKNSHIFILLKSFYFNLILKIKMRKNYPFFFFYKNKLINKKAIKIFYFINF